MFVILSPNPRSACLCRPAWFWTFSPPARQQLTTFPCLFIHLFILTSRRETDAPLIPADGFTRATLRKIWGGGGGDVRPRRSGPTDRASASCQLPVQHRRQRHHSASAFRCPSLSTQTWTPVRPRVMASARLPRVSHVWVFKKKK